MAIHIDAEKYIQDLVQFYNLKQMSKTQLNKFNDLQKKGHLTKGQENWKSMLATGASAKNFSSINVEERKAVYNWLQEMFRSLQANERLMLEDKKVKNFVNTYYGPSKAIKTPKLANLIKVDGTEVDKDLGKNIEKNANAYAGLLGGEEKDYKSLGKNLADRKYMSDPETQQRLLHFLNKVEYYNGSDKNAAKLFDLLPDCMKESTLEMSASDAKDWADYIKKHETELIGIGLDDARLKTLSAALEKGKPDSYLGDFFQKIYEKQDKLSSDFPKNFIETKTKQSIFNDQEVQSIKTYIKNNADSLKKLGLAEADILTLQTAFSATPTYTSNPVHANTFIKLLETLKTNLNNAPTDFLPDCFTKTSVVITGHKYIDEDKIENIIQQVKPDTKLSYNKLEDVLSKSGTGQSNTNIKQIRDALNTHKKPGSKDLKKLGENITKLFEELVKDEKLRDKVISAQPDINQVFNNGLKKSNYNDGDNKLGHKIDDPKSVFKRAKQKINDKYDETLGKLTDRHKRHMYKTDAKHVVGALIGKGVKPTDGMTKVFEEIKTAQGKMDKTVQDKMKWGIGELEKLSGQKYFKDALRNGRDMNYMVQQIVADAAQSGNKEEAMMLLETLAIMRYDLFSSSVRKQLRDSEIKIFSGTSLAGENAFMGNLMGGIDKTLRFAALGMFEVANLVKNAYKAHGSKVTRKNISQETNEVLSAHEADMAELFDFWNFVNSGKSSSFNPFISKSKAEKNKPIDARFAAFRNSKLQKF